MILWQKQFFFYSLNVDLRSLNCNISLQSWCVFYFESAFFTEMPFLRLNIDDFIFKKVYFISQNVNVLD